MAQDESGRPFYERQGFKGAAAVLAVVVSLAALIGPPHLWDVIGGLFSSELPSSNIEILLDASQPMGAQFEAGTKLTKLTAAEYAVREYAGSLTNEGLALRRVGGDCLAPPAKPLVAFGANHGDDVSAAASDQQSGGESNLARTFVAAIEDFNDSDRFPDPSSPKQVVVFTGTADQCEGQPAAVRDIRSAVMRTGIHPEFRLVGVNVPAKDKASLRNMTDALGKDATVDFAATKEELRNAVKQLQPPTATSTTTTEPSGPTGPTTGSSTP